MMANIDRNQDINATRQIFRPPVKANWKRANIREREKKWPKPDLSNFKLVESKKMDQRVSQLCAFCGRRCLKVAAAVF